MGEIIVDRIFEEPRTGTVILSLHQLEPWDTPGIMEQLRMRVTSYVTVIRDGLFIQQYPQYDGCTFRIRILCEQMPPNDIQLQIDEINGKLRAMGIELEVLCITVGGKKFSFGEIVRHFMRLFGGSGS